MSKEKKITLKQEGIEGEGMSTYSFHVAELVNEGIMQKNKMKGKDIAVIERDKYWSAKLLRLKKEIDVEIKETREDMKRNIGVESVEFNKGVLNGLSKVKKLLDEVFSK